jgi:hypothetical protein
MQLSTMMKAIGLRGCNNSRRLRIMHGIDELCRDVHCCSPLQAYRYQRCEQACRRSRDVVVEQLDGAASGWERWERHGRSCYRSNFLELSLAALVTSDRNSQTCARALSPFHQLHSRVIPTLPELRFARETPVVKSL